MDFSAPQEATICHLLEEDLEAGPDGVERVLLMRKKRGVGAGLYNGPGGKVEPDETPRECAVREAREELRVDVHDLEKVGELGFAFGRRAGLLLSRLPVDSLHRAARGDR